MTKHILITIILAVACCAPAAAQTASGSKKCTDCHNKLVEKKFMHGPVGENCDKCHQSNGKAHPNEEEDEAFTLSQKMPALCYTCHENTFQQEFKHSPFDEGDCLSCHEIHSSNQPQLIAQLPPNLCYFCHTDLKESVEKATTVHAVVNDGKSCLNCHSPHASAEKKILIAEEQKLCLSCHDKPVTAGTRTIQNMKETIEGRKYVHGAIDNGCTACHNPHASSNQNILKLAYPVSNYAQGKVANYALCFDCHEKGLLEDPKFEDTGFRDGERNLHYVHINKDKGRSCFNCHDVHASNNLFLIADKIKFGEWQLPVRWQKVDKGGSCSPGCHGEKKYQR